jgi:exopolyphosphatase/guanosine-5'-triphosphate,3'-diphosphate pyrophosphatase
MIPVDRHEADARSAAEQQKIGMGRRRPVETGERQRQWPSPGAVYGAVDLGTHNCRMLIARIEDDRRLRVIGSFSRAVRLGEGVAVNGRLAEPAIARALGALAVCARRMRNAGVRRSRGIATEACRRADNGPAFLKRVEAETGIALEPVTPAEEAQLTLAGCVQHLDPRYPRVLLFDIGGGSTEITWIEQALGRPPHTVGLLSLPHGVVTFAERFGGDRIAADGYAEMARTIDAALAGFDAEHAIARNVADGRVQMLGTSGTVTTLAAVHLGLKRYDRKRVDGLDIGFDDIAAVSAELAVSDWSGRAANPCIGPVRADLVVAGCAILEAVCRRWPVGRLRIADRGIREGLLLAMVAAERSMAQAGVRVPVS